MVLVDIIIQMEQHIKVNGKMINNMDMVKSNGQMVLNIKDNILMVKSKEKED